LKYFIDIEKIKEIEDIIIKQQIFIEIINGRIFNNTIEGQTIEIINNNFDSQINKISNTNTKDLFISSKDSVDYKFKKYKKTIIRKMQINNNTDDCEDSMTFCLPSGIIKEILKNENSEKLGFNSLLNKNKNIQIKTNGTRKIFSKDSLDFELKIDEPKSKKFRKLDLKNLNVNYNIRLKIPDLQDQKSDIGDSLCVQYEKNNLESPTISCATWYDYLTNEVVCECQKQGLTINLMDSTISHLGILKQFTLLKIDFCNFLDFKNK